ncbi:MAG: hypothetical protein K2X60_00800, partial [Xanthobacteraceae bacterium]|nr:hypothetical protein [Xanthobacteraceae bacterium]
RNRSHQRRSAGRNDKLLHEWSPSVETVETLRLNRACDNMFLFGLRIFAPVYTSPSSRHEPTASPPELNKPLHSVPQQLMLHCARMKSVQCNLA